MVVPLLPSSPAATGRGTAAGRVSAQAGDFAADLDALLAAASGTAAGLAALLGGASPNGATSVSPTGATTGGAPFAGTTPAGTTPAGAPFAGTTPGATPPPAVPTDSTPPGPTPAPTLPIPPSPNGETADPSRLPLGTNPGLLANPTAVAATAEVIGAPAAPAGPQPWATSPSPTGEAADPTGGHRPGPGAASRPSTPVGPGGAADAAPATGQPAAIDPRLVIDPPPATIPPPHAEAQGPSVPSGPPPVAAAVAQTSGHRAADSSPVSEPAPLPAIPVRIAELTRRRTGVAEQIVIRLDPPELGTVRITVTARGDNVHIALRADTPEARAALAAQRDTIETLLSGEGFDLSSFDVGYQRQDGGQPDGRHRANGARFSEIFDPTEPAAPTTAAADGALRL